MRPVQLVSLSLAVFISVGIDGIAAQTGSPNQFPERPTNADKTPPPTATLSDAGSSFVPQQFQETPPSIPGSSTSGNAVPGNIEVNDLRGTAAPQIPAANSATLTPAIQQPQSGVVAQLSDGDLRTSSPPMGQQIQPAQPATGQPIADAQPLLSRPQDGVGQDASTIQQQSYTQSVLQQNSSTGYQAMNPAASQSGNAAAELLNDFLLERQQATLPGQPMELLDILANADVSKKREIVHQYWSTFEAWANFRCAQMELNWLRRLDEPSDEISRLTFRAAESAAQDQLNDCRIKLTNAQTILNGYLNGPKSELMPLPSDSPLVGNYRTNFELYAARKEMPEFLRAIHVYLPEQKMLLTNRAATVRQCRRAVTRASQMYTQRAIPIGSVLSTVDLAKRNHQAFIASVTEYNQKIGEYALSVKPNQSAPDQIVAMLIPVRATLPMADLTDIRHATLPEENRATNPPSSAYDANASAIPLNSNMSLPQNTGRDSSFDSNSYAPSSQVPPTVPGNSNFIQPSDTNTQPPSGGFQPQSLPNSNFNPTGSGSSGFQPPSTPPTAPNFGR